jgi:hypothetical protein
VSVELAAKETHNIPRKLADGRFHDELELHFADEERFFLIKLWKHKCPCFQCPVLQKKMIDGKFRYRVSCQDAEKLELQIAVELGFPSATHQDPTPWLSSSKQAIAHWKVLNKLLGP